jgi:tricorn protease
MLALRIGVLSALSALALVAQPPANRGYYRFPTIHGSTVVFTAEGDLWQVSVEGGLARRLTTHAAEETHPRFSPDGRTLAFTANYEGASEVYTMPATGGLPSRRTFGGGRTAGWTPSGHLLFTTTSYSAPPGTQLAAIDDKNNIRLVPLSEASQGSYDPSGKTLFFTRYAFQGSHAKRYKGGTAQNLWRFAEGAEAVPLTSDYPGTSRDAMHWKGRLYFATDRDGTMNLWSMDENGKTLRQHTRHEGWDVSSPDLHDGRVIYQLGADLHIFDIASGKDVKLDVQIPSDFDHLRERWVKNPLEYATSAHVSHDGSRIAITARGRVFVVPAKQGRLVEATAQKAARYRDARLLPDGKSALVMSSESGEVEVWKIPANGIGAGERLTTDGAVLRWDSFPSPDGKWAIHTDKANQLWILDLTAKTQKKITVNEYSANMSSAFDDIRWSSDSRWVLFAAEGANTFVRVFLYSVESGSLTPVTSDRYNSSDAVFSADGKYIYFVSDRALRSLVASPWGPRQPDPYFDRTNKVYQLALKKDLRSPFEPSDELHPDDPKKDEGKKDEAKKDEAKKDEGKKEEKKDEKPKIEIDLDGLPDRIEEVPVSPGNYSSLSAPPKRICFVNRDRDEPEKTALQCLDIQNKGDKPDTVMEGIRSYELSGDGKKLMIRKANDFFVVDSSAKGASLKDSKALGDAKVDLSGWTFSVIPSEEFREALLDAWRLHRDYFYAPNMHGVDWGQMKSKYLELVNRVRDRAELNDLIAKMISELSILHSSVVGGDQRQAPDQIRVSSLGARLERDETAGGWVVKHVYRNDPDRPDKRSPLARPGVNVNAGDVIVGINGRDTLSATHPNELLRNLAGKQTLIRIKPAGKTETRDVIVKPITTAQEMDLRYGEWEYTRRLAVERASTGKFGYIHLRAMGSNDIAQFVENYYPVFDREGLIIDVRDNGGGNIDSWILAKLMRKPWMYWKPRIGQTTWNMQYAFRGHMVVLCDAWTGSDGEAFADGFRRLGLGQVIGTRTWGGEVWLSASNRLADQGIATTGELGVFGPEGKWLIEGHGVDPDIVVDNLPHATFNGKDAQLDAAIAHLQDLLKKKPVPVPKVPAYPDKSFKAPARTN